MPIGSTPPPRSELVSSKSKRKGASPGPAPPGPAGAGVAVVGAAIVGLVGVWDWGAGVEEARNRVGDAVAGGRVARSLARAQFGGTFTQPRTTGPLWGAVHDHSQ